MAGTNTDRFKPIGRRLAEIRLAHGLTQRALAELLGKPRSFVGRLELAERRLDVIDLLTLAEALGVHPPELLAKLTEPFENAR